MKIRNLFAAVVLTAVIAASASAGHMQTDAPSPGAPEPTPTPVATASATAGDGSSTQQTNADGTSATLAEVVMALIQSSLLPLF